MERIRFLNSMGIKLGGEIEVGWQLCGIGGRGMERSIFLVLESLVVSVGISGVSSGLGSPSRGRES